MKSKSTNFLKHIPIYALILLSAFSVSLLNPANPFSSLALKTDSAVFSYIGKAMNEAGAVPYRDIFDHKGPLLYLFNYIAYSINNSLFQGVYAVGLILLIVDFILIYKIANKLTKNIVVSACTTVVSAILLSMYYSGGNFSEMYALPFTLIALYYFIEYFLELDELPKFKIFIIGVCFGMVLMIRPNIIAVWVAFCLGLIIYFIAEKKYKDIFTSIILFLSGAAAAVFLFIIYLAVNSAFSDFIKDYWIFNFAYAGRVSTSLSLILSVTNVYLNSIIGIAIVSYFVLLFKNRGDKKMLFFYGSMLLFTLVSFYFIVSPGNPHRYYGISSLPCAVAGIAYGLNCLDNMIKFKNESSTAKKYLKTIVLLFCILILFFTSSWAFARSLLYTNTTPLNENTAKLHEYITQNTDEDDEILVIGNQCSIYLETDRMTSFEYIYQIPICDVEPQITDIVLEEVKLNKNAVIIFPEIHLHFSVSQQCIELLDTMDTYQRYDEEQSIIEEYIIYERIN